MFKKITQLFIGVGLIGLAVVGVGYLLASIFHWSVQLPSAALMLDVAAGVICLTWLLFILKVPWDLYFEAGSVLFEMQRSRESGLPVNPERTRYVRRLQWMTGLLAVGSHLLSAGIIAGLTYWARGQLGYYFAFFYVVATFFRPTSRAYYFLLAKLREIRNEVKYPREDVFKLRQDVAQTLEEMRQLKEELKGVNQRAGANEESARTMRKEIGDVRALLEHTERSFQERIHRLSEEVERSLMKAFDNQDIVNGLSAFARLIKHA